MYCPYCESLEFVEIKQTSDKGKRIQLYKQGLYQYHG